MKIDLKCLLRIKKGAKKPEKKSRICLPLDQSLEIVRLRENGLTFAQIARDKKWMNHQSEQFGRIKMTSKDKEFKQQNSMQRQLSGKNLQPN